MGEGQEVGGLDIIYSKFPQVGNILNMWNGSYYLYIYILYIFNYKYEIGILSYFRASWLWPGHHIFKCCYRMIIFHNISGYLRRFVFIEIPMFFFSSKVGSSSRFKVVTVWARLLHTEATHPSLEGRSLGFPGRCYWWRPLSGFGPTSQGR